MKTAYIELNTTDQIKSLSKKKSLEPFVYKGIHIFPSVKVTSVSDILCKDFDYFILDMGVLTKYTAVEFSKCHKQFLICDLCEWKKELLLKKIKDIFELSFINKKGVIVLKTYEKESTCLHSINKNYKTFPFIENPFHLSVTIINLLNILLS